jgi:transcriptional regulator with XRE-family HTH domain
MGWNGENIKIIAKDRKILLTEIAKGVNVSRQTINDWIKGQIPGGHHLIALCKFLQIQPEKLFTQEPENTVIVPPLHRRMGIKKITDKTQQHALELAQEYTTLFRNDTKYSLQQIVRIENRSQENAINLAQELRELSGLSPEDTNPLSYENTFNLLHKLGINVIFRTFPEEITSYAFYTKIHHHRVIFVNNNTNLLDLIFPLLHDAIHAIRDGEILSGVWDRTEEDFCDMVASHTQFHENYIKLLYNAVKHKQMHPGARVNTLKTFARNYKHSLYGVIKRFRVFDPKFKFNLGADTNLKKDFPTIGKILFRSDSAEEYIELLTELSPNFIRIITDQLDNLTDRKLGDLFDLENVLDAKEVRNALRRQII